MNHKVTIKRNFVCKLFFLENICFSFQAKLFLRWDIISRFKPKSSYSKIGGFGFPRRFISTWSILTENRTILDDIWGCTSIEASRFQNRIFGPGLSALSSELPALSCQLWALSSLLSALNSQQEHLREHLQDHLQENLHEDLQEDFWLKWQVAQTIQM